MVRNKYLDPIAQKAYIDGINGCVQHITVVQEVIQHAKINHKIVHMTWFDLEDAFGSISHVLIPFCDELLQHSHKNHKIHNKVVQKVKRQGLQ